MTTAIGHHRADRAKPWGHHPPGRRPASAIVVGVVLALAVLIGAPPSAGAEDTGGTPGQLASWGNNTWGQLGNGSVNSSAVPVRVETSGVLAGKTLTQVSAGFVHACAVTSQGEAVCWGQNALGQLGVPAGDQVSYLAPVKVDTSGVLAGKEVRQISAGDNHTCAVTSEGRAACWGLNGGALGNGTSTNSATPVAVDTSGVLAGTSLVQISAGDGHTCALSTQGQVFCWGYNGAGGVLGDGTTVNTTVPVAVSTAGALAGQRVTQVAAGPGYSCAVTGQGQVVCWGINWHNRLGNGTATDSKVPVSVDTSGVLAGKKVVQVATGYYHACAVTSDGHVACWGTNISGELGDGTNAESSAVPVAVDASGVLAGQQVVQVAAGAGHTCALTFLGKVLCWGDNWPDGQLGNGTQTNSRVPVAVDTTGVLAGRAVAQVAAGNSFSAAIFAAPTPPAAPRDVVAIGGDRQVSVGFNAPSSTGGSAIINYQYSTDAGATWVTRSPASTASPLVIPGLANGTRYQVALRAINAVGAGPASPVVGATPAAPPLPGQDFTAITPTRFADTREGFATADGQGPKGTLGREEAVRIQIAGRNGLPAAGVSAIAVNITATGPSANTFLTAWPTGEPRPNASNLNLAGGQTVPNMATVKLGADGSISLFNARGATHVVVDVLGWFPDSADYNAVTPARFADTRPGSTTVDGQGPQGFLGAEQSVRVPIAGRNGLPASGMRAVAVNITVTGPSANTFLTAWPTGEPRPNASNLNLAGGQTVSNMAIIKLGADGSISVYNDKGTTHVVVDVLGWFPAAAEYTAITPTRFADTRTGFASADGLGPKGPLGAEQSVRVPIAGRLGLPLSGISAVAVNVTATGPSANTFLTAWPTGQPRPNASNLNTAAGSTRANMAIIKLGADGSISIYNDKGTTHVIVDVLGWFPQ